MEKHILLISCNLHVHYIITKSLKKMPQYKLQFVSSEKDALDAISCQLFDVIVVEMHMPGCDGISLCSEMRKLAAIQDVPIVMLASSNTAEILQRGRDGGVTKFIFYPIFRAELMKFIESLPEF